MTGVPADQLSDEALERELKHLHETRHDTFLHGSEDPRPITNVLDLAANTPVARRRIIKGAGHFPWVERPGETADLLHEVVHAS